MPLNWHLLLEPSLTPLWLKDISPISSRPQSPINPIPKVSPPTSIESDLRPIALICTLAKVMEGFVRDRLFDSVRGNLDPRQFARVGYSTTDALVYLLQAICEAVDTGKCADRLLFADVSKGFDLIDHEFLINELKFLDVHPVLVNWIQAFLSNRTQAVKIGSTISEWKAPKGGIPQGTKLGVLFTIMTNNLLRSWHQRTKFVDDTTALEIIPRNGTSLLSCAANDIYSFSNDHGMRLNPINCKEMTINFMHNHNLIINPIVNAIEGVTNHKLQGVFLSSNLSGIPTLNTLPRKQTRDFPR